MSRRIWLMLLLVLWLGACGEEGSRGDGGGPAEGAGSVNEGGAGDLGGSGGGGSAGEGPQAPTGFGLDQFVYLRTPQELVVGQIEYDPVSEEVMYGEALLYKHSSEIESFIMLQDRSGVIFTADRPRDGYTHAVYAVSFEGGVAKEVMEPFEGNSDGNSVIFKVVDSLGGLEHPLWFTMYTSTLNWNSMVPMWYRLSDNRFDTYKPGCTIVGPVATNLWTGEVAMRESWCGGDYNKNFVTIFSDMTMSEEEVWMAEGDGNTSLFFAHTMRWYGDNQLLVGVGKGLVLLKRGAPREPTLLWEGVSYFDVSPDYEWILGVSDGELIALRIDSGTGWILSQQVAPHNAPSW